MENISSFTFWKGNFTEEAIEKMKDILWFPKDDGSVRVIDNNDDFIRVSITELQYKWIMKNLSGIKKPERPVAESVENVEKSKRKRKKDSVVEVEQEKNPKYEVSPNEEPSKEEPKKEVVEVEEVMTKEDWIIRCIDYMKENKTEFVEFAEPVAVFTQGTLGVNAGVICVEYEDGVLTLVLKAVEGSPEKFVGKTNKCKASNSIIPANVMEEVFKKMVVYSLPFN